MQTDGPIPFASIHFTSGSFFFALALTCMLASAVFAAGVLLAFIVYFNFVVRAEEHFLRAAIR
ncbi:MAG: hypothetical protein IPK15_25335 [Verrucomicrobia bacterium]|nr:hypothetical protein [Verrucomicrobiota bacterium]